VRGIAVIDPPRSTDIVNYNTMSRVKLFFTSFPRLRKNSLGAGCSAGFQPATPLLSSEAGRMPALQRVPQRVFPQPVPPRPDPPRERHGLKRPIFPGSSVPSDFGHDRGYGDRSPSEGSRCASRRYARPTTLRPMAPA
jgi:hypothetical protein